MGSQVATRERASRSGNSDPIRSMEPQGTASAVFDDPTSKQIIWTHCVPFVLMHVAVLAVFLVGVSPVAVIVALLSYGLRMFGVTAFYHRYFSHRAFKTSRWFQFVGAFIGGSAAQRGPLWWAAHHRNHHRESDFPPDVHSPVQHGFWWSHVGWFLDRRNNQIDAKAIKDFFKFPELRLLDKHTYLAPLVLAVGMFLLGAVLNRVAPQWGTNGCQMLVWGFFVSTIVLYHATYCINSLAHVFGRRRYQTTDDSRNNLLLALLTFGEGWHNNHHRFPASASQGFFWWEIDVTYSILRVLSWFRLVWELKQVPHHILEEGRSGIRAHG